jgi:transposase
MSTGKSSKKARHARKTLQSIIPGTVEPESIIHSDAWLGYRGSVYRGYKKHYGVHLISSRR